MLQTEKRSFLEKLLAPRVFPEQVEATHRVPDEPARGHFATMVAHEYHLEDQRSHWMGLARILNGSGERMLLLLPSWQGLLAKLQV